MENEKPNAYVLMLWGKLVHSATIHNVLAAEAGTPALPVPMSPDIMVSAFALHSSLNGESPGENSFEFLNRMDAYVHMLCQIYDGTIPGLTELAAVKGGEFALSLKVVQRCKEVLERGCKAAA